MPGNEMGAGGMHSDLTDLLKAFNECGVEFMVVGAYAVMECTEPRFTKGFDIWIRANELSAKAVYRALALFGAPLVNIDVNDFAQPGVIYQIGVSPHRVDVLTEIDGVDFEDAWIRRVIRTFDGVAAPVISISDLIRNKEISNRPQDTIDVVALKRIETANQA